MILKNFIVKNRKTVDNFFFFFALTISKSDLRSINKRSINLYLKFSVNKIQKLYPKPLLINRLISRIFVIFFRRSLNDNKKTDLLSPFTTDALLSKQKKQTNATLIQGYKVQ